MNTKITLVEYVRKGPCSVEGQELHALTRIVLCALDVRTYVSMRYALRAYVDRYWACAALRANGTGLIGNRLFRKARIMGYNAMVWDHGVGYNATVWYGIGYNAMV